MKIKSQIDKSRINVHKKAFSKQINLEIATFHFHFAYTHDS